MVWLHYSLGPLIVDICIYIICTRKAWIVFLEGSETLITVLTAIPNNKLFFHSSSSISYLLTYLLTYRTSIWITDETCCTVLLFAAVPAIAVAIFITDKILWTKPISRAILLLTIAISPTDVRVCTWLLKTALIAIFYTFFLCKYSCEIYKERGRDGGQSVSAKKKGELERESISFLLYACISLYIRKKRLLLTSTHVVVLHIVPGGPLLPAPQCKSIWEMIKWNMIIVVVRGRCV